MLLFLHLFSKFEIISKAQVKQTNKPITTKQNKTLSTVRAAWNYAVLRSYETLSQCGNPHQLWIILSRKTKEQASGETHGQRGSKAEGKLGAIFYTSQRWCKSHHYFETGEDSCTKRFMHGEHTGLEVEPWTRTKRSHALTNKTLAVADAATQNLPGNPRSQLDRI